MRIGMSMALLLALAASQARAQDSLHGLPDDLARELRAVNKMGCKEHFADTIVPGLIRTCTKVLERKNLTERQRAYAYFVRGRLKEVNYQRAEALADFEQSIALNPNFGPVYDWRAGGANADRESVVRDFQKAIELGYRGGGGPRYMSQWRLSCPTLAYRGNECLPSGGTRAILFECNFPMYLPEACGWKQQSPKGLVECEPGFNPGPGCTQLAAEPDPAIIGLTPLEPALEMPLDSPTAPASPSTPSAPPTVSDPSLTAPQSGPATSWFAWRPWRKKPAEVAANSEPAPTVVQPAPVVPPPLPVAPPQTVVTEPGSQAPIPPGCPIDQQFGGWTIRRGSVDGIPVVTLGAYKQYSGTATQWSAESLSLEMIPTKAGKWMYFLFAKNLKHAGTPVTEITGPFGASIWDSATKKGFSGFERKNGGGTIFQPPYVAIGLPPFYIEDVVDKIESTAEINFALVMPTPAGVLTDINWIQPFQSSGLRAAMAAGQSCALN